MPVVHLSPRSNPNPDRSTRSHGRGGTDRHADTLGSARALEALAGQCRTLHARLAEGRWARTRSRLRKQLRRLGVVIDGAQRVVLAGDPLVIRASQTAIGLGPLLDHALRDDVTKAELKALRRACKRARHRLEAVLPEA